MHFGENVSESWLKCAWTYDCHGVNDGSDSRHLVRPVRESKGYKNILTVIDGATSYPATVPFWSAEGQLRIGAPFKITIYPALTFISDHGL